MALDLYVGPLSRYHAGDWKTVGEQMAETQGLAYQVIGPDGALDEDEETVPIQEIEDAIEQWQRNLREVLIKAGEKGELWSDRALEDYATDRPGWSGWTAVVLKYAYLLHPQFPEPDQIPPNGSFQSDPAFVAANEKPGLFQVLSQCELWIPGDFSFMFPGTTLTGKKALISSLGLLRTALDELCRLWGKDRAVLLGTATDEPSSETPLDEAALHGLAVFVQLTAAAESRGLPMILDY